MIYIVHGNNYASSRRLILNQQKKLATENKLELNIKDITPGKLTDMIGSFDIFGNAPFIILNITDAKSVTLEKYIATLENIPAKSTLILISAKKIRSTSKFLKGAKLCGAKILLNDVLMKSNIFKFVEALFSKKRTQTYSELSQLVKEKNDPFYILSMIYFGLRSKTSKYSHQKRMKLYEELYKIEKQVKTGGLTPNLALTFAIEKVLTSTDTR